MAKRSPIPKGELKSYASPSTHFHAVDLQQKELCEEGAESRYIDEAGPTGFWLVWRLRKLKIVCEVVSLSQFRKRALRRGEVKRGATSVEARDFGQVDGSTCGGAPACPDCLRMLRETARLVSGRIEICSQKSLRRCSTQGASLFRVAFPSFGPLGRSSFPIAPSRQPRLRPTAQ